MSGIRHGATLAAILLTTSCSGGSVSPDSKPAPVPQSNPANPAPETPKAPVPADDQAAAEARDYVAKRYKGKPAVAATTAALVTELEAALAPDLDADMTVAHMTAYLDHLACWRSLDPKTYERDSEDLLDRMLATPERYEAYLRAEKHLGGTAYRPKDDPKCEPKKAGGGA